MKDENNANYKLDSESGNIFQADTAISHLNYIFEII